MVVVVVVVVVAVVPIWCWCWRLAGDAGFVPEKGKFRVNAWR